MGATSVEEMSRRPTSAALPNSTSSTTATSSGLPESLSTTTKRSFAEIAMMEADRSPWPESTSGKGSPPSMLGSSSAIDDAKKCGFNESSSQAPVSIASQRPTFQATRRRPGSTVPEALSWNPSTVRLMGPKTTSSGTYTPRFSSDEQATLELTNLTCLDTLEAEGIDTVSADLDALCTYERRVDPEGVFMPATGRLDRGCVDDDEEAVEYSCRCGDSSPECAAVTRQECLPPMGEADESYGGQEGELALSRVLWRAGPWYNPVSQLLHLNIDRLGAGTLVRNETDGCLSSTGDWVRGPGTYSGTHEGAFDHALCAESTYRIEFATEDDESKILSLAGDAFDGASTYEFETAPFIIVPRAGVRLWSRAHRARGGLHAEHGRFWEWVLRGVQPVAEELRLRSRHDMPGPTAEFAPRASGTARRALNTAPAFRHQRLEQPLKDEPYVQRYRPWTHELSSGHACLVGVEPFERFRYLRALLKAVSRTFSARTRLPRKRGGPCHPRTDRHPTRDVDRETAADRESTGRVGEQQGSVFAFGRQPGPVADVAQTDTDEWVPATLGHGKELDAQTDVEPSNIAVESCDGESLLLDRRNFDGAAPVGELPHHADVAMPIAELELAQPAEWEECTLGGSAAPDPGSGRDRQASTRERFVDGKFGCRLWRRRWRFFGGRGRLQGEERGECRGEEHGPTDASSGWRFAGPGGDPTSITARCNIATARDTQSNDRSLAGRTDPLLDP